VADDPALDSDRRYSPREVGGAFLQLIAAGIVGSGLLVNPVLGRILQGPQVVDKADVLLGYWVWSMLLGGGVFVLGRRFARRRGRALDAVAALTLPVVALVLMDRLLLVHFGLPLWVHDPVLGYRQRPGAVRTLARARRPDDRIRINRYGQHDTEFPVAKAPGEFRGLMIGDSITMGDQVPYSETFSAQLEALLDRNDRRHGLHQIINTGVHGYTTYQELEVLRESLHFDPDFIAIGFCMNDLTEPSLIRRGVREGTDYHGVAAAAGPIRGYLLNETGFGRLAEALRARSRTRAGERYRESQAVRRVAALAADDPEVSEAWRAVTSDLESMYALAKERNLDVVLLIFPFTFQLAEPSLQRPQEILREHAARHGVAAIDFTPLFAERIYRDRALVSLLREHGYGPDALERVFLPQTRRYFLDGDHLSKAGHGVVAERLLEHLTEAGLIGKPNGS